MMPRARRSDAGGGRDKVLSLPVLHVQLSGLQELVRPAGEFASRAVAQAWS